MYSKILVPLDGCLAAERIFEQFPLLGDRAGELHLLRVVPSPVRQGVGGGGADGAELEILKEAEAYLGRLQERLREKGFVVMAHVRLGEPGREIVEHAERWGCDLIAMTSYASPERDGYILGEVTGQVLRASRIPVLLMRTAGAVSGVRVESRC